MSQIPWKFCLSKLGSGDVSQHHSKPGLLFSLLIILKTWLLSQVLVDVSMCQIAGRALKWAWARRLRVQQGSRGCLHRKFMFFWVLGSRCTIPSAEPPAEPSAEGATFRLWAVCGALLGLSILQIPRDCRKTPLHWWVVPQAGALGCYFSVWSTWYLPWVAFGFQSLSWGLLYWITCFSQICNLQKLSFRVRWGWQGPQATQTDR